MYPQRKAASQWQQHGFAADVNGLGEKEALYFSYKGTGAFNFMSFDLK